MKLPNILIALRDDKAGVVGGNSQYSGLIFRIVEMRNSAADLRSAQAIVQGTDGNNWSIELLMSNGFVAVLTEFVSREMLLRAANNLFDQCEETWNNGTCDPNLTPRIQVHWGRSGYDDPANTD